MEEALARVRETEQRRAAAETRFTEVKTEQRICEGSEFGVRGIGFRV